ITRYTVARRTLGWVMTSSNIESSLPVQPEVLVAINGSVAPRAKLLVARHISLAKRAHPGVLIDHRVWISARRHVSPLPKWRGRSITMRAHNRAGVCRSGGPNVRCSMRLGSIRPCVVGLLTPRRERQRETSDAY